MIERHSKYCLDANIIIRAWQEYYSPKFCPSYWEILQELGTQEKIFLPQMVLEEITRTDDDLSGWLKQSKIPIRKIDEPVTECLKRIYEVNPSHKFLVDNIKQRSLADPWVIAHALNENAIVVTKEAKEIAINTKRIKIPNVCENMGIKCINDFQLIEELNIKFSCILVNKEI
jgi:predicted nucleic acid-binding protein